MFIPNNTAKVYRINAGRDVRGKRTYAAFVRLPCAVVSLGLEIGKTAVRADTSGTRGRAEEMQGVAVILFPRAIKLAALDMVQVDDATLEVIQVYPRRHVLGWLDHYEVQLRQAEMPT